LQPAPVLASAVNSKSGTVVQGTLTASPSTTYVLQFFANPTADPSGFGQGGTFLLTNFVTTNSSGVAAFSVTIKATVAAGQVISATATSPAGNPSAFSNDVTVTTAPAPAKAAVVGSMASVPMSTPVDVVLGALSSWDAQGDSALTDLAVDQVQTKNRG